jgi:hypothetical protein
MSLVEMYRTLPAHVCADNALGSVVILYLYHSGADDV